VQDFSPRSTGCGAPPRDRGGAPRRVPASPGFTR
jgi:hypothetical protein